MRPSTSFITLVALVAVGGAAAPINAIARSSRVVAHADAVDRENQLVARSGMYSASISDLRCSDCRDQTIKKVSLDQVEPMVESIKAMLDADDDDIQAPHVGEPIDDLPPIHATLDIGDDKAHDEQKKHDQPAKEQPPAQQPPVQEPDDKPPQEQAPEKDTKPSHNEDQPPRYANEKPTDGSDSDSGTNFEIKTHADSNASMNLPKDGESDVPCPDESLTNVENDAKNVHDQTVNGVKGVANKTTQDVHDTHSDVQGQLESANEDLQNTSNKFDYGSNTETHVDANQTSDRPEDCEDIADVNSDGGKSVVSSSIRRFVSRILQ